MHDETNHSKPAAACIIKFDQSPDVHACMIPNDGAANRSAQTRVDYSTGACDQT